jgi:phenylpropionate dioxygenase-like ring-hydroxylating dioxygenase large terminal subunit
MMREVGTDSVIVMGGEDGRPHAFLNVCRHRGRG